MEQKNDVTRSGYAKSKAINNKKNSSSENINISKMNKNQIKKKNIIPKNLEKEDFTFINESKKNQKQIKQCFYDLIETKEQKEENIKKNSKIIFNTEKKDEKEKLKIFTDINIYKVNLKNKYEGKPKKIKVNKIKIEKNNKDIVLNINNTNRGFYIKPNKKYNSITEESTNSNKNIQDYNKNKNTSTNLKTDSKRKNILSDETFSRINVNNGLFCDNIINNENINFIKENSDFSLNENYKKNINKYNMSTNTNTCSNTTAGKSNRKLSTNSSRILLSFKNIKTICAHLEIFKSLYLKVIFKFFIEQLRNYKTKRNINSNLYLYNKEFLEENKFKPFNDNNNHFSLFSSVNLSQDKKIKTLYDQYVNNTLTPLQEKDSMENLKKRIIDNKKNRMSIKNQDNNSNTTLSYKKTIDKVYNKNIYVPKKKISKNIIDIFNKIKDDKIKLNSENITFSKDNKSKPFIKEMNINFKKINVCKLNELNQQYIKQKILKNNNENLYYSEINKINLVNHINKIENMTDHNRNKTNHILFINYKQNFNNNFSKQKSKLKKNLSTKNSIYMKPKDKDTKKKIKEIKIRNGLSPIKSFRRDIEYHIKNSKKIDNIGSMDNSFYKNKYKNDSYRINDINLNTINYYLEPRIIKNIYINRNSKDKNTNNYNKRDNNLNLNKKNFYSSYSNFNIEKEKKINNDIFLVKQIITSDNRVFINLKYIVLIKNNYITNQKKSYNALNLKVINHYSITIINNKIKLNKEIDNSKNIKIIDINSFVNRKGKTKEKINSKNISYSYKENSISKEEVNDYKSKIDSLRNFIRVLKSTIIKSIRKYLYKNYKKKLCLKKLLIKKNNEIIYFYFMKFKNKQKNIKIKLDKNNYGVYYKINYNDDFNLNKRLKSPKNSQKNINNNIICRTKPNDLNLYNTTSQYNKIKKINDKNKSKEISLNSCYQNSKKFKKKQINICVHNNNNSFNNFKNKIFLLRIILVSIALRKKIKCRFK